jgi:hypothetical protein
MSEALSTLLSYGGKLTRDQLALVETPPATATHRPVPHSEVIAALVETLAVSVCLLLNGQEIGAFAFNGDQQLRQRVLQTEFDGVPWAECTQLGNESVPYLTGVLTIKNNHLVSDHSKANAVVCLGILGDPRAVGPLRNYLEAGRGRVSVAQYLGKVSVLWALGAIANQSRDERALQYLIEGLDSSVWSSRVHWVSPHHDTSAALNIHLARESMQALAISASAQALEAIEKACKTSPCPMADSKADALTTWHELDELAKKHGHKGNALRIFYSKTP